MNRKRSVHSSKTNAHLLVACLLAVVLLLAVVAIYANGARNGRSLPTCGNGLIDVGEQCDSTNLDSKSCSSFGFPIGTLACTSDCELDTTQCTACGNGVVNKGEQCDSTNLAGKTCQSLGFKGGALSCTRSCVYTLRGCTK